MGAGEHQSLYKPSIYQGSQGPSKPSTNSHSTSQIKSSTPDASLVTLVLQSKQPSPRAPSSEEAFALAGLPRPPRQLLPEAGMCLFGGLGLRHVEAAIWLYLKPDVMRMMVSKTRSARTLRLVKVLWLHGPTHWGGPVKSIP